jgi:hypothetical protein
MVFKEFTLINGSRTHLTRQIRLIIQVILLIWKIMKYCKRKQCKMRVSSDLVKNSWEPPKEEWPKKWQESYITGNYKRQCSDGLAFAIKKIVRRTNSKGLLHRWGKDYWRMRLISTFSFSSGAGSMMSTLTDHNNISTKSIS